jgi:hypothetical protein
MAYRNGNYSAFYVNEEGSESNLRAHKTKDFVYYNLLKAWKKQDSEFSFNDSHNKNYNVRDGSDWEKTLKPRIHERLNNSKNIILFLSTITKSSRALREEIFFGVGKNKLPVIVVYPEYENKSDISSCGSKSINQKIRNLWNNLPVFRDSMNEVPTIHIPMKKDLIKKALEDKVFMFSTKGESKIYFYSC